MAEALNILIVDDGSHNIVDQVRTLEALLPFVKPGGLYIVEDINVPAEFTAMCKIPHFIALCNYGAGQGRAAVIEVAR